MKIDAANHAADLLTLRLIAMLRREINMNDIDMSIQWQEGSGESVEIGFLNPNPDKPEPYLKYCNIWWIRKKSPKAYFRHSLEKGNPVFLIS